MHVASTSKIAFITTFHKGESRMEFLEQGLIGDGLHYTDDRLRFILDKALEHMGRKITLRTSTERIDRMKVWPDRCWVCGASGRDCRRMGHIEMETCDRCGKDGQSRDVCWFKIRQCQKCGRRGHGGEMEGICTWF